MSKISDTMTPLRLARLRAGVTQAALAHDTGRSQAFVSRVENGSLRGADEFYEKAAAVLDTRADRIVPEQPVPEQPDPARE